MSPYTAADTDTDISASTDTFVWDCLFWRHTHCWLAHPRHIHNFAVQIFAIKYYCTIKKKSATKSLWYSWPLITCLPQLYYFYLLVSSPCSCGYGVHFTRQPAIYRRWFLFSPRALRFVCGPRAVNLSDCVTWLGCFSCPFLNFLDKICQPAAWMELGMQK